MYTYLYIYIYICIYMYVQLDQEPRVVLALISSRNLSEVLVLLCRWLLGHDMSKPV